MFQIVVLFIFVISLIYLYFSSKHNYWKKNGVEGPVPLPIVGNTAQALLMKKSMGQLYTEIYEQYHGLPYVGMYNFDTPYIVLRDVELIKDVLHKEFSKFHDNNFTANEEDGILSKNPFFLRGQHWKAVRSILSSSFSSGKIKLMNYLLNDTSNKMVKYIEREIQKKTEGKAVFEAKELCAKYTTENIALCAFGADGHCFDDPNAEFREIGRKMFKISFLAGLSRLVAFLFPRLSKIFSITFIPRDVDIRFRSIVRKTLRHRKENNIVRKDYLDILSQAKLSNGQNAFTEEEIAAHVAGFFTDGFETSSITFHFLLYDLAANKFAQDKLKEEIDRVLEKYNGELTYEAIQKMEYLECCLNESLRLHPPGLSLERICTEDYTVQNDEGSKLTIKAGTATVIPVYGLHMDEKYFENATAFDPDRFSQENKSSIVKGSYLPFGDGPRVCLGKRFAVQQVKIGAVHLVKNYNIEVNDKTITPLQIDPLYFMKAAKGGIWLNFSRRS